MHAAVITEPGRPPRYLEFRDPELGGGEVLVHVKAAGLHPLVRGLARGTHYASGGELPAVAGVDGIGMLESGQRVYFLFVRKPWGPMAELAPAQRSLCVPVPEGVSDVVAAAIVNPGVSAWMSQRHRAKVEPGETVLVLGATGVAGQLAIQTARLLGARRVIGVGRNVQELTAVNPDRVIGLTQSEDEVREAMTEEAAKGIDAVVDYLWGPPAELLLDALARQFNRTATHRTRWVQVGDSAGKTIPLAGGTLRSIDLHLMGSGFGANPMNEILMTVAELLEAVKQGELTVSALPVPLNEVEHAWEREAKGERIVLII